MKIFSSPSTFGLVCCSLIFTSSVFSGENGTNSSFVKVQAPSYGTSKQTTTPVTTLKEITPTCSQPPASFRFSLKSRAANGIGYENGYSSLNGFFLFHSSDKWFPFFDVRTHLFYDGKPAANFGFGVRYLPDSMNAIFGLNGFLDIKATSNSSFEQAGLGMEILGTKWHMRANGYFPIFGNNHVYEIDFYKFKGNHAIFRAKHDLAFKGYDISCGRLLLRTKLCDLSTTLGGYQFFSDYSNKASGGLLKFQSNLTPYLTLETQGSYDSLFKGILQIQAAINLPFGKRVKIKNKKLSCAQSLALARRITEEVDRFEIIVSNHYHIDVLGKDPRTRDPLHIVFVDNTNSGGHGTAESPYNTLLKAQDHSSSYDMIYVYGGDGTPKNMSSGITLQEGQWLQSASRSFILSTAFGPCGVPRQSSLRPSILNDSGNTIVLADDNIIVGFDLRSSDSNIFGSDIENTYIAHNHFIRSDLFDMNLNELSGTITIENNSSLGENGLFLSAEKNIDVLIENNTFANAGLSNFTITVTDNSVNTIVIQNNTFTDSLTGSRITSELTSSMSIDLENNTFFDLSSSAPYCLEILATADSTATAIIKNNLFNSPTPGLQLTTSLFAKATWQVYGNVGHYTGTASPVFPFTFTATDISTTALYLVGNFANSSGYLLDSMLSASFSASSLDGTAAGLKTLNTGNFVIDGPITYIPYNSSISP